jgi:hypothetical protein
VGADVCANDRQKREARWACAPPEQLGSRISPALSLRLRLAIALQPSCLDRAANGRRRPVQRRRDGFARQALRCFWVPTVPSNRPRRALDLNQQGRPVRRLGEVQVVVVDDVAEPVRVTVSCRAQMERSAQDQQPTPPFQEQVS